MEHNQAIVETPIINSPYDEPTKYWKIRSHEQPLLIENRRPPTYLYAIPNSAPEEQKTYKITIHRIETIRERLAEWRELALKGEGGVSRVTMDLLNYWRREGRQQRLFFAQLEAAETIIFLTEARPDFLQGIDISLDEPGEEAKANGFEAFKRLCCKMATGAGKTTVMAMLAAWSILNKVNNKGDVRFSKVILIVCPNVTIRDRLAELNPQLGEASIYRTRDLAPDAYMPMLAQGKVHVVNWHIFEPLNSSASKVVKTGKRVVTREMIRIGDTNKSLRGKRYMTEEEIKRQTALGLLELKDEKHDKNGNLKSVIAELTKYVESDTALVKRVLHEFGGQQNLLVFNDEAHHAYRLSDSSENKAAEEDIFGEDEVKERYYKEATVWVDGLDKINKLRGINFCIDFSATPYFLGRSGDNANRVFPWTVSNFGLEEAIEAGLVKSPELAVRDSTGAEVPGYFNIWKWILPQLTATERGGRKSEAKPEAVLKYAHTPIAMLGGMWEKLREEWGQADEERPPVFIIVCKNTKLAKVVYEWLAEGVSPTPNIPTAGLESLRNTNGTINTIRVDSKVQEEIDSGNAKSDENRWMRYVLNTIGHKDWRRDSQGKALYPQGFEALAEKLGRDVSYPPGRDIRCIVSVGMLTEGWDCNTVTHIIGLRPFMSQLLCEQVIGRGLRRRSYDIGDDGLMSEETAIVLGVPLTVFPVKASGKGNRNKKEKRHIYAVPGRKKYAIKFPRVEGYRQIIKQRLTCDMEKVAGLKVDPSNIPPELEMKAALADNSGRPSLHGPGKLNKASLDAFRKEMRTQQRVFEMANALAGHYDDKNTDDVLKLPRNVLFSQIVQIVRNYIDSKVDIHKPADRRDAFLAPYYGEIIERLLSGIRSENSDGSSELPRYERTRGDGSSADVDFRTTRTLFDVRKSHVNAVVADTKKLEQSAAYVLDTLPRVEAFIKNEGLGFGIPYFHNGETHEYMPDFIVRMDKGKHIILETKGYDELKDIKKSAADRWVDAVNADGKYGVWEYCMVEKADEIYDVLGSD